MITLDNIKAKLQVEINNCGLTKTEIARRLGVSNQTVSCYARGTKSPSIETFANLCKILDIDPSEVLCLND